MKILVINSGSSSVKYQLFNMGDETVLVSGLLERIGDPSSRLGPRKQIIIQFCLSFGPASVLRQGLHKAIMRPLPRLESEPKSGAIFGQLFISAALNSTMAR